MTDEIKKISVRIGGMSYQLVSAEDERYTRQIAATADEMIRRVMQNNPQLSQNMAAILALINSLDDFSRLRRQYARHDEQRQLHDRQISEARAELSRLREQNWEMKKEILRLNALCRDYETLLGQRAPAPAPPDRETIDEADDTVYRNDEDDTAFAGMVREGGAISPPQLKQTRLDEYLKENGWPPVEQGRYDAR